MRVSTSCEAIADDRDRSIVPAVACEAASPPAAAWGAVVSLSLGVFGLVTAEFLPASLLTAMARDLGVSDGVAGQAVTAAAVVAAIAGPLAAWSTRRFDRRLVMWTLSALLVLSSALAAVAQHLAVLLVARMVLGASLGAFWSMSAALAMRLVPADRIPRALSIVFTGVSVATVCAAPVGAWIGGHWGWRMAFALAAAVGLLALAVQAATLPRLPPRGTPSLSTLPALLRRPAVRTVLVATLLLISGHFAGFTYIRPFLEQVPRFGVDALSLALLGYGVGGFFGNLAGGVVVARSIRACVVAGGASIGGLAVLLAAGGASAPVAFAAVAAWGFAFGFLPIGIQTWSCRWPGTRPKAPAGCWSPRSRSRSRRARSWAVRWWTGTARAARSCSRRWRPWPARCWCCADAFPRGAAPRLRRHEPADALAVTVPLRDPG